MEYEGIELRQYLAAIRRWLWLIVLGTFLAGATALVVSFLTPPIYQAEAGVLIVRSGSEIVLEPRYRTLTEEDVAPIINMQERRKALTALVSNSTIASQVIGEIGSILEPEEREVEMLLGMVEAKLDGDLIRILVEADSPEKATTIANAWAHAYEGYVNSLYVGTTQSPAGLQIQADEALGDYQEAEAALTVFLGNNKIATLTDEIGAKEATLDDYYAAQRALDRLLADAKTLWEGLGEGVPSSTTGRNSLALLLLRARASTLSSGLLVAPQVSPGQQVELQVLLDQQTEITEDPAQQLSELDTLIANLEIRLEQVLALIDEGSLQQEILQLQGQLEQERARERELTSARDLAWETYQMVARKVAEVQMATQTEETLVRFAVAATEPESPIRPRKRLNTLLGSVVGAMLAMGAVFTLEYLDQSITTAEDVTQAVGLPTLGSIVAFEAKDETQPVALRDPLSPAAESFRMLRTRLEATIEDTPSTFLIASPTAREGKSTIAANLAVVLAQGNSSVILVDSDLRRPVLHTSFGLPNDKGLSDFLREDHPDLDRYLRETEVKNLRLITSGPLPPNPSELLQSARIEALVEELKSKADLVLFDSPAILAVTDADVLGKHVDGVLLTVEAGRTEREATRIASERLATVGSNILGVVLNKVSPSKVSFYYYRGGSGHRARKTILPN